MEDAVDGADWLALTADPLDAGRALSYCVLPACGAVASFVGTVREHAEGLEGIEEIDYEAYEDRVVPKMRQLVAAVRQEYPSTGRVALWHRSGPVRLGEASLVVALSAPHREEAFTACRLLVEKVKASLPIWKTERYPGGERFSPAAREIS